jgi:hypothetical protein
VVSISPTGYSPCPPPPTIILTSSTDRACFGARLNGHRFIAKADICAAAIVWLARTRGTGGPESPKSRHSREAPPGQGEKRLCTYPNGKPQPATLKIG